MGDTTRIQFHETSFYQDILKQVIITFRNVLHIPGVLA
jgi:hypothetical protein